MRRFVLLILAIAFILSGCISSTSTSSKKNYRLPREGMRKHLGAHAELAMVLGPTEIVQRELRQEIAGDDGVHPDYAKKFDAMIAAFDDTFVEGTLSVVLRDYITADEAVAMSDYLDEGEGQQAINTLNEQLIDFAPSKQGPAPIVAQALGSFAKTEVGKKWIRLSPKLQNDFTKTVKAFSIQETRRLIRPDKR